MPINGVGGRAVIGSPKLRRADQSLCRFPENSVSERNSMKKTTALIVACALLLCGCSKTEDTPEFITTPAETSSETAPTFTEAEESPYRGYAFDNLTQT